MVEEKIQALIEAGWYVLESNFDEEAFEYWRIRACEYLETLFGPSHAYTIHFKLKMGQTLAANVLSGVGVLTAASLSGLPYDSSDSRRTLM